MRQKIATRPLPAGRGEDARLTALILWTHQSSATNGLDSDVADVSSNPPDEGLDDDKENGGKSQVTKGLTLIFDVVRRFS